MLECLQCRTSGNQARLSQLNGHSEPPQLDWSRVLLGGQEHAVRLQRRKRNEIVKMQSPGMPPARIRTLNW